MVDTGASQSLIDPRLVRQIGLHENGKGSIVGVGTRSIEVALVSIDSDSPQHLEAMPFPIDGLATGFEDLLREEKAIGDLDYDVPPIKDVSAQDLVTAAYNELRARPELQEEFARVSAVAQRWGY